MKECFKCHETKLLEDFYKHPRMADGHVNKCKQCNKTDVSTNYHTRRDQYAEYERQRFQQPARKLAMLEYQRTRRARYPDKYKARQWVTQALASCSITPQPCQECGDPAQAHHADYSKPAEITWLCRAHHLAVHGKEAY